VATSFERTMRSLEVVQLQSRWLALPMLMLAAWTVWLLASQVHVYAASGAARFEVIQKVTRVAAPKGGRIVSLALELGRPVREGDVIAALDDTSERRRRAELESELRGVESRSAAVREQIAVEDACGNPNVLGRIVERFAWAEEHTWRRGFIMASLQNARLSGHPYFEPGIIERRYCMADATMTNGSPHTVYYAIEFGQGFASIGNYVNFCVLGLDPWHIYDEACRTVR